MKRRTLDIAFSIGGTLFALLLVVLGMVLKDQADFASNYVAEQLSAQQITFVEVSALQGEQAKAACLVEYAGSTLDTGKKAECYANEFIEHDMAARAKNAGYAGESYATMGPIVEALNAELRAAQQAGEPTEQLQAKVDAATSLRETMFKGETLRGLLLTTFGFSIFGDRADTAGLVCLLAAALLLLLSAAGFAHALMSYNGDKIVFPITPD